MQALAGLKGMMVTVAAPVLETGPAGAERLVLQRSRAVRTAPWRPCWPRGLTPTDYPLNGGTHE